LTDGVFADSATAFDPLSDGNVLGNSLPPIVPSVMESISIDEVLEASSDRDLTAFLALLDGAS
jgi:hypothetical protein